MVGYGALSGCESHDNCVEDIVHQYFLGKQVIIVLKGR